MISCHSLSRSVALVAAALLALAPAASQAAWWAAPAADTNVQSVAGLESIFGTTADGWKIALGKFTVARDADLGADVLTATLPQGIILDGQTRYSGAYEVRARLRLRTDLATSAGAYLSFAQTNAADQGYYIGVSAPRGYDYVNVTVQDRGHPLHDLAALGKTMDWGPPFENSLLYYLRAYDRIQPGWEESFRQQVETAMARLPDHDHKWLELRVQLRSGSIRVWIDDRLVATKQDAAIASDGTVKVYLTPGAQLAAFAVTPAVDTTGFVPIPLAGYANGRALLGTAAVAAESLPPAGEVVLVEGVPFVFPGVNVEGQDHLDLSQSLLRQANSKGYIPSGPSPGGRWLGAAVRDPARIQVRIPNGTYNALHLVAAADGKEPGVPVVSAMFYRPGAGYPETVTARVPLATATSKDAKPLAVTLTTGKRANLWLVTIPLEPAVLASLADLDIIEVEFTKEVYQYRSYPDPIDYSFHQGGPPSGVHVYAATLQQAPWRFAWNPDRFGHVWTAPEVAAYTGTISNATPALLTGKLTVTTRSYDGTEETKQEQAVTVPARGVVQPRFSLPVKLNGLHEITARLQLGDKVWVEQRSFVRLAPDTRSVRWTEGKGAMYGWWSYLGGHYTPKVDHHIRLMTLAGARQTMHTPNPSTVTPESLALMEKHWGKGQATAYYISPQPWAANATHDPKDIEKFQQEIEKAFVTWEKETPEQFKPDVVNYFTESHITPRLTAGNFPEYWQDPPFEYTAEEKERLRMFMETARIAGEYLRKTRPDRKLMIEWGSPVFVVPLLRAGFPKNLIDGSSLDMPLFERLPEMQLADNVVHQLYELRQEYLKYGMTNPRLQYCEGTFVPTEPGAVTYREQMDSYTRWTLISLGYGVSRFYAGWFAFDCGNYYGTEHYGGCGIQRRIPYCDPKPAYAAYATLTDKLNEANFDGWLPTGSLTTYCLRFKHETRGPIYTLWTVRGQRPVTLTLTQDGKIGLTDCMNNTREIASTNKQVTFITDQSPVYVTGATVASVKVGTPDYRDAKPAADAKLVANLGDGSWRSAPERLDYYENNHWGYYPALGKFSATVATDSEQGPVLVSKLENQGRPRELMPWYTVLKPRRPIELPGAPSALGLWARGASDWGRMIYVLRDAKGERWTSIGTKDDYNCNDIHCWSVFNFDGWRYLSFELPGHLGYDNFRRHGTTWWRADGGDDIVDLPLRLESVIVEQRTHILYVNDVQPVASDSVAFGQLYVEYARPADATPAAVELSRLRTPPPREKPNLPNPITDLAREGVGEPTKLLKLTPPEHWYDGTRMHVHFAEVPGAKAYHLWVGAYADGRGAVDLVPAGVKTGDLVTGLRPGIKLYYWITYVDAQDKPSKPSAVHEEVTVDNFKEK